MLKQRNTWNGRLLVAALIALAMTATTPTSVAAAAPKKRGMSDIVYQGPRCTFTKKEAIAMVSWIFPIAGAVITGLACKRDLF